MKNLNEEKTKMEAEISELKEGSETKRQKLLGEFNELWISFVSFLQLCRFSLSKEYLSQMWFKRVSSYDANATAVLNNNAKPNGPNPEFEFEIYQTSLLSQILLTTRSSVEFNFIVSISFKSKASMGQYNQFEILCLNIERKFNHFRLPFLWNFLILFLWDSPDSRQHELLNLWPDDCIFD